MNLMEKMHDWLLKNNQPYASWHKKTNYQFFNWLILSVIVSSTFFYIYGQINNYSINLLRAEASSIYYVDNQLATSCLNNSYSTATRNCTGTDGNAYTGINDAVHDVGLLAGSTILVRQGTYQEVYVYDNNPAFSQPREAGFYLNKPITLKNYNAEPVTLTYIPTHPPRNENNELSYLVEVVSSNVTVDGFTIIGTRDLGDNPVGDTDVNINIDGNFTNLKFQNNIITKAGHAGIKYQSFAGPITIQNNQFYDIGFKDLDHGIYASTATTNTVSKIIRYNVFHDITGFGIHLYSGGASYHTVYNNIIYNNAGGILVTGDHNQIYNNVLYNNRGAQGGLVFFHYNIQYETVKNNILWGNWNTLYNIPADLNCDGGTATGNIMEYNDIGSIFGTNFTCTIFTSTTDVSVAPQFTSSNPTSWMDFRLANNSPLIDRGVNLGPPFNLALDATSVTWPSSLADQNNYGSNWEMGVFVFGIPNFTPTPALSPTATPTTSSVPDTTKPTVSITSPLNNSTINRGSTMPITSTASDNIAVTKIEIYLNNNLLCADATSPYSCSWKVPAAKGKVYTLQAKAYNSAGNFGTSSLVKVTAR